jgi:SNF2 family DNA or RNA helicase
VVIHGNKRQPLLDQINQFDVVVTTYPLMLRDEAIYCEYVFEHIILDEAQQIKNAQAKVTQVIKTLRGRFRLCLSGTPLENHLGELKSLMDFCLPGLLGQHTYFNKQFRGPIEKQADVEKSQLLSQRIAPFMLRRTKKEVVSELPEKTVIIQTLELERDQRNLYESIRLVMEKKLRELFAKKGVSSSHIEFLDALLKLRQACCDPRLVKLEQAQQVKDNAKMTWLIQNLPEMIEEGRKILIFSQFTGMLALIEDELKRLAISYSKLTGQTRDRQTQIDSFQEGDNSVFLISLKAGGTGLNLTAADTVIHFDPWWNPAAERQATDRAHRIGQLNPVFVYKLIAQGTVEEKIQEMQQHKQGLADSILSDGTQGPWQGSANDLLALLS